MEAVHFAYGKQEGQVDPKVQSARLQPVIIWAGCTFITVLFQLAYIIAGVTVLMPPVQKPVIKSRISPACLFFIIRLRAMQTSDEP